MKIESDNHTTQVLTIFRNLLDGQLASLIGIPPLSIVQILYSFYTMCCS